ncbi:response regulator [bacterium]|nr:response regulator [bacterium]MBU1958568.1 response regulator [bacterium]
MSKIDILIVEDEAIVALEIKRSILKMGFNVSDFVSNYEDALISVREKRPDIVLLDINLKNSKDGIEIAKEIKKIADIPIIYLTAFSDDKTITRAVQTNPIGYLVKPFKREDLKSTLQLSIYKINSTKCVESSLNSIGHGYSYDTINHNLFFKEHPIKLSQKERILLEMLIEAKGNIIPFAILENHIWNGSSVSDSALRTLLYRLRGKLDYTLIETVPSFGFRLTPPT